MFKLSWLFVAAMLLTFTSCKDDDPDPIVLEDGFYLVGDATSLTEIDAKGLFKSTRNEVGQVDRPELREIFVAVQGGAAGFNIVSVTGGEETFWGPGADFAKIEGEALNVEEPRSGLWRGSLVESETVFAVEEDGLYHVAFDTELMIVIVAKADWGVIGGATPGGWSNNTPMPATFNLETMSFEATEVTMLQNEYKFRYSDGWKVFIDTEGTVKLNCNLGGSLTDLVPGGDNMAVAEYAIYTINLTWSLADGISASLTKTGDAEPLPEYPENLYMIGATIGGWDWTANGIQMIPVHSHPELFWAIVWCEAGVADVGTKFAPVMDWGLDFGVSGDATDGVFAKGSDNMPDVAVSGYYMIVVDLENETIERNAPKVHIIGDAIGSWDAANPDGLFTAGNSISITKDLAAANLRLHVAATTLNCDWWQAEFNVINGAVEYRGTGGDQEAVALTAGNYTIDLHFFNSTGNSNVGTITAN